MINLSSVEPEINPNGRPTFLLDWELTLKCNLDCSYCRDEPDKGGHWTLAEHPPLEECLKTIDFMFEYVDLYMTYKPKWTKLVVLNVYGGESLLHPDIVEILQTVKEKYKKYQDKWPLRISCTTNLTIGINTLNKIIDYIDEWTISYHCESLPKHKQQFKKNALTLKEKNKSTKCIVLMHGNQDYWPELLDVVEFCKEHNIRYLQRQLDGSINNIYNAEQIEYFKNLYVNKNIGESREKQQNLIATDKLDGDNVRLADVGRACCGGRNLCVNKDLSNSVFYIVGNNFKDWSCSVNWFFLFIKQHNGNVWVNKDCRMRFDGTVGPIGNLKDSQKMIDDTRHWLETKTMPVIKCAQPLCYCGLCAPKALTRSDFDHIIEKHVTENVFK